GLGERGAAQIGVDIAGLVFVALSGRERARLLDGDRAVDRHAPQHDVVVGADLGEPGEVDDALTPSRRINVIIYRTNPIWLIVLEPLQQSSLLHPARVFQELRAALLDYNISQGEQNQMNPVRAQFVHPVASPVYVKFSNAPWDLRQRHEVEL